MNKSQILTYVAIFVVGVVVKTLVDLDIAAALVKYCPKGLPLRFIFRHKYHNLVGTWDQILHASSPAF